jgi:predicted metal-dependent hydrolase
MNIHVRIFFGSIAMHHHTPALEDLAIPVRDLQFSPRAPGRRRWWHNGDPVPTAFFNALSCTFPAGEKFFMDSVRRFRREAPEPLRSQITAFLAQEAVHSREHSAFNALAAESGYDIARLEDRTRRVLDHARARHAIGQLAGTCALEHFTAILAHHLLATEGAELHGAPDEAMRLWCWHAVEEIEHKAVAFDTFLMATQGWSRGRRYRARVRAMLIATGTLFATIAANMADLYREDGLRGLGIWARTLHYLFVKPGVLRRTAPAYFAYYKPGFHPWQHDDRALLKRSEARLGLQTAAA